MNQQDILLSVQGLKTYYPIYRGIFRRVVGHVKAVDGVDFFIKKGETLGLVGESGCGKTTAGRSVARLIEPTAGSIVFRDGETDIDITTLGRKQMKKIRRKIQVIFQDPYFSLNPRMSVRDIIADPLDIQQIGTRQERTEKVKDLLEKVGLNASHVNRYPHEFSGGQRQRIGIARALALDPELIICDEPVSALDVSVQAQVLNLLSDLQTEFGLTYLFVAHDLSVVEHISDRLMVMYLGKIIEVAKSSDMYRTPEHPYTEALLSSIPVADPRVRVSDYTLEGNVPSPANPPNGCNFNPRCRYAQELCKLEEPSLRSLNGELDHQVACHFAEVLNLTGFESRRMDS